MQNFWACSLTCRLLAFCGQLCTLNVSKMALVSNENLVSFSRKTEKMGDFLSFCRLLTRARFECSSRTFVMRAMKFRMFIAKHIV